MKLKLVLYKVLTIVAIAASFEEHKNQSKNQGGECTTFDFDVLNSGVHTSCGMGMGEMCVEDSTSSIGGRCIVVSGKEIALGLHCDLNACRKCESGCRGVNPSKISCGFCNADRACWDLPSHFTVGENSCNGRYSCQGAKGELSMQDLVKYYILSLN